MKNKALCAAFIAIASATSPLYAGIDTNKVDWTSEESVLAYVDELAVEYRDAFKPPLEKLTPIQVPANELWRTCLDFDIPTNDFATAASLIRHKKGALWVIAHIPSYSLTKATNHVVAATFIRKIQPIKDAPRGKPLPPPIRINPFEIGPDDSPGRIEEINKINGTIASNNAARVAAYNEDQTRRNFYREFDSFYWFLNCFTDL